MASCTDLEMQKEFVTEATRAIFPWCMTHNHATRAFAQLTIDSLIHYMQQNESLQSLLDQDCFSADRNLNLWPRIGCYLMQNKEFIRLKKGLGDSLKQLEAHGDRDWLTPKTVFAAPYGGDEEGLRLEAAPESLLDRVQVFLAEARIHVRDANASMLLAKEGGSQRSTPASIQSNDISGSNIQRKITTATDQRALIHGGDVDAGWALTLDDIAAARGVPLFDEEDLVHSWKPSEQRRQSIIVVASLIDKAPNIAGLARTCEVFQAKSLVIGDRAVLKSNAFASISVTAEKWLEIEEVKSVALKAWLRGKRMEGYRLIGLEQTSQSRCLSRFQFPRRCVLILGEEKNGIPSDLLQEMDTTVEIPQLGMIRSLNVHVSGALAIYEYTRQHQKLQEEGDVSGDN